MRLTVAIVLATVVLASAAPTQKRQEPGPSGGVVTPSGGKVFYAPNNLLTFDYKMFTSLYARTRSVNIHLINKYIYKPFNVTLASDLTAGDNFPNIKATFRLPLAADEPSEYYQLQVIESQNDRRSDDSDYAEPFVGAAPFMTVYPTSEPDPTDTTKDTDGPGPSGRVITPSGGASFAQYGGFISFEYEGVDLWYAKTRSVNAHLIQQSRGYNHTLALDLSGPEGDRTHPKAFWRIPRSASPGTYQLQVIETQVDPRSSLGDRFYAQPFQAAAPYINIYQG